MKNSTSVPTDIWCNPLTLENYPIGFLAPGRIGINPKAAGNYSGPQRDYREMADPEVLYDDGKWYMFPSVGDAYVSDDLAHWEYRKIEFVNEEKLGYAPTIAKSKGRYLLSSSWPFAGKTEILTAPSPLGPYHSLGEPVDGEGLPLSPEWLDPMLFADDDGKLYAYWHFGGEGQGIYGIELDPDNPVQGIGKPVKLLDFTPENRFECFGDFNEHSDMAWIEGESMFKHNGEYYLQYSGCGTQFRAYTVGVSRSKSPLGPFIKQKTPVALEKYGRVCGTGHGCWATGPDDSVWQFYTVLNRRIHMFERRVGMDRVEFDQNGDAHVQITAVPQSVRDGDAGVLPVSVLKKALASSSFGCCYPGFAFDDCTHTWWMPDTTDEYPWLEINLQQEFDIHSFQIIWAEEGVDIRKGVLPEPAKYKLEFFAGGDERKLIATSDFTGNDRDLLIDFRCVGNIRAQYVRLSFLPSSNPELRRGVNNFTVFGKR
ncbi:MAG: hypothetical protein E7058_08625 [Lentisphaerae bacterium]|nr:hypothetical protein [Lentisphaerota bacterium]